MNTKKFGANSKKLVVLGMMLLLFAAGVGYAAFVRHGGNAGFNYGYGYGNLGYGYGYGYRNDNPFPNKENYGFLGPDGKAIVMTVVPTGTSFTVIYHTGYLAQNKIQYGATNAMSSHSSESAFQSGNNYITISDLGCGSTYYFRVVSRDAGGNIWYSTPTYTTITTSACGFPTGGVGGVGGVGGAGGSTTTTTSTTASTINLPYPTPTTHDQIKADITYLQSKLVVLLQTKLLSLLQQLLAILQQSIH